MYKYDISEDEVKDFNTLLKSNSISLQGLFTYSGGGFHGSLFKEYQIIKLYKKYDLPVMKVVAFLEKKRFGLPVKEILIVKEAKGEELYKVYLASSLNDKRRLLYAFGRLIGETHNCGIDSIVRVHDIFCTSKEYSDFRDCFTVIDREHGSVIEETFANDDVISQLAKVFVKAIPFIQVLSSRCCYEFLKGYCKERSMDNTLLKLFWSEIVIKIHSELNSKKKYEQYKYSLR